jgi:cytidine deaminase
LLEVNKLILARRQFPNPSNIYNGSLVEMDGGLWGRGVGAEGHQEFPVCAEKSAICDALTRQSENIMDSENDNHQSIINKTMMNAFPKVNRIFHAGDRLKPCGECLDWMNSGVFFKPNTEIVRLYKEPVANNTIPWVIDVRQVQDLLPMSLKREISYTPYRTQFLPLALSPDTKRVMAKTKMTEQSLMNLMEKAQSRYFLFSRITAINLTPRTHQNMSAAVLLDDGNMSAAPYLEVRRGIQIQPDMAAFTSVLQKSAQAKEKMARKVTAVAYFGQNPEFPRPSVLHGFSHEAWGSYDVVILTIEDNKIMAKTIREYLQDDYSRYKTKLSARREIKPTEIDSPLAE